MKNKLIIKISVFVVISAVLIFIYVYCFNFLKNKSQNIADKKASINNQITKVEQSFDTKKQSDVATKIGDDVGEHFLKSSEIPVFLNNLESIGGRAGSIIRIASVDESVGTDSKTLNLNISASGSYAAVYKTLVEIENLPYLSSINNLSISIAQNQDGQPDAQGKIVQQKNVWLLGLSLSIKSYIE